MPDPNFPNPITKPREVDPGNPTGGENKRPIPPPVVWEGVTLQKNVFPVNQEPVVDPLEKVREKIAGLKNASPIPPPLTNYGIGEKAA